MKPIDAPRKLNEKKSFFDLPDKSEKHESKIKLGQLLRTSDIKSFQ